MNNLRMSEEIHSLHWYTATRDRTPKSFITPSQTDTKRSTLKLRRRSELPLFVPIE